MKYLEYEKKLSLYLKEKAPTLLRCSMALIFFWYGALKLFGTSPVEELVIRATHWVFSHEFVMVLGVWEVLIGIFLFARPLNRYGLLLLFAQFPGTFLPLFTNPEDCFTSIPFGLTLEGQYIFKNLILIAVGIFLISTLHKSKKEEKIENSFKRR